MKKALIGNGGHAREVMCQMDLELLCFVDDDYLTENTLPLSKFDPTEYEVMIAISDTNIREKIVNKLPKETKFFTFIHPSSLLMKNVKIGVGSFIGAYSILTSNIEIGNHCILNRGNHIGHDSIIGNFFSAMPGSIVSGNCKIGNKVFLGTNSSIRENIIICDEVIIGLNSGVVEEIKDKGIYGGVPSKLINK